MRVTGRHAEALRHALYNANLNHQLDKLGLDSDPELSPLRVDWELATVEIP